MGDDVRSLRRKWPEGERDGDRERRDWGGGGGGPEQELQWTGLTRPALPQWAFLFLVSVRETLFLSLLFFICPGIQPGSPP